MKSLLVYVKKANLLEGKLSSNSGFLVLEQSCWFLHFSWQQVLPIVCGSRQDVPPAWPRCSSITPAQLSWWLLLANTLFKEKQAAEKAAFNSLSCFGWMSPRSTEIFPELRHADWWFRHEVSSRGITSRPRCVSQGFCFHFDVWTESLVLLGMSKFLWLLVSGLLLFLPY